MVGERAYDVVVYGATGAVGRIVAGHLAASGRRWAVAGRDRDALAVLAAEAGGTPGVEAAGLDDPAGLAALARRSAVVVDLAGPYGTRPDTLVPACVAGGAHVVSACAEPPALRTLVVAHDGAARAAGVAVVVACGTTAAPADLAMRALHERFRALDGSRLRHAALVAAVLPGRTSGVRARVTPGVAASTLAMVEPGAGHDGARLGDPYALVPGLAPGDEEAHANALVLADRADEHGRRLAPVVPNPFTGPQVVHRSGRLLGPDGYADGFTYGEAIDIGTLDPDRARRRLFAAEVASAARRLVALSEGRRRPMDRLILRTLAARARRPRPGNTTTADPGRRLGLTATSDSGRTAWAQAIVPGDPALGPTGRLLAEAALALATTGAEGPAGAGVLTPATALGLPFLARLPAAGITLTLGDTHPPS